MPEKDPNHWLYRLTADEWLRAAENELRAAQQAFLGKQQRTAVTHARRAAGMALNALLVVSPDEKYGRSYMDHLQALSEDPAVASELRAAATRLLQMPLRQELVVLGPRGDVTQADAAARIVAYAASLIAPKHTA